MNRFTKLSALALAAGCALAFAACGSSATKKTPTGANWDERVIAGDLTDQSPWFTNKEVATYALSFSQGENLTYSVEYVLDGSKTAEYRTEFYAVKYDWNSSSIPEEYRTDKIENVYAYKTTMTVSGRYVIKATGASKEFDDCIENICYFRSASNNLQPVYSKQSVKSTAPANLSAGDIEAAYVETDAVYETFYSYDCSRALIESSDSEVDDRTAKIEGVYSIFDTSALDIALRSLTATSGSTYVFDVMIPINGGTAVYQASCSDTATLNAEDDAQIIEALNNSTPDEYIFVGENGEGVTEYSYNTVTLSLVSAMPGPSFSYSYAHVPNNSFNTARAVLLKVSSPLYFGLGTMTYTLSSLALTAI